MNAMQVTEHNLYKHIKCNGISKMPPNMMADLHKNQYFYGVYPCSQCGGYHPVSQFVWIEGAPGQQAVTENKQLEGAN